MRKHVLRCSRRSWFQSVALHFFLIWNTWSKSQRRNTTCVKKKILECEEKKGKNILRDYNDIPYMQTSEGVVPTMALDQEWVGDHTACNNLQMTKFRVNRIPNATNISPIGHVSKSGALSPSDLCTWSPQNPACKPDATTKTPSMTITKWMVVPPPSVKLNFLELRRYQRQGQMASFRTVESSRMQQAKLAMQRAQAHCTQISSDLKPNGLK